MSDDLALYSELLIYLSGAFIYGFIARQLVRQPALLPRNLAVRWAALAVTVWYGGCLLDEVLSVLVDRPTTAGSLLDVARGAAWLAALPTTRPAARGGHRVSGRCCPI